MNQTPEEILNKPVQFLKSIGPKRAESFKKLGIVTVRDLLFYFPSKHLDRTTILTAIKAYGILINGYEGELTIVGSVYEVEKIRFRQKQILKVHFRDKSGMFECIWFQGLNYFAELFHAGDIYALSGKPSLSRYGNLQFTHPDFDRITEDESNNLLNTGKIIPFYRIPKDLRQKSIGDFSLRKIISSAVVEYSSFIQETLPAEIIHNKKLISISEAVKNYHFPESPDLLNAALQRLKFEEMFYLEILIALRKHNHKTSQPGQSMKIRSRLISEFLKILPFQLTKSQLKVLTEIKRDMESESPMNRLLQGDVGSGKTIVALIAMLIAVDNDYQAVLMAPTEILADQHAKRISSLMKELSQVYKDRVIRVSLVIGGQKKSERETRLSNIELQGSDIIIGTHALFEKEVKFKNLGLVIVDEQHRFGVEQRAKLINKGITPDVIVMSATPIPRTLSLTLYGDLDVSTISEMPQNRKPIKTFLRGESKLPEVYKFIEEKTKEGYQSFIVYPLIEESEKLELKSATTYYKDLSQTYFKNIRLGLIHGRMSWQEKEEIMSLFLAKQFDVLISTTVIEVGIDIPDANIMLINDAHRFGLSQLHQLRGRIGRGNMQAYCILIIKDEYVSKDRIPNLDYLSNAQIEKQKAIVRLQTMAQYNDGFKISEIDLKLRGPGDIFGTVQSGFPQLRYIDVIRDSDIIMDAKKSAFEIIKSDPHLLLNNHLVIKNALLNYYKENLKYAKIA
ncbi:MAG: ATP-dependent DNA helicase RecG [Ignavibacteriaceae bacterium]|nr:ATP-dependent DNA helicase RecG [Ignavibacteriaceae bacterium]